MTAQASQRKRAATAVRQCGVDEVEPQEIPGFPTTVFFPYGKLRYSRDDFIP